MAVVSSLSTASRALSSGCRSSERSTTRNRRRIAGCAAGRLRGKLKLLVRRSELHDVGWALQACRGQGALLKWSSRARP